MAHARRAAQFGTWSAPQCPFVIEYDLRVLDEIGREIQAAIRPQGGVEIGGLLFGTFDRERLRILGYEPLQSEHAFGPTFQLSENDRGILARRLAEDDRESNPAYYVVGWYHSHLGGGPAFSDEDIALHDRYFPEPWHIILLERPGMNGRARTGFFFREPGGGDQMQNAALEQSEPTALIPWRPAPVERPIVPAAMKSPGRNRAVWIVLACMLAMCVATVIYLRLQFPPNSKSGTNLVRVEAVKRFGIIEVSWDKAAISGARKGRLEVRDGVLAGQIPLDSKGLAAGRLPYRQTSDIARFRLVVERPDGAILEGSATFVTPDSAAQLENPPASQPAGAAPLDTAPTGEAAPLPEPISIQQIIAAQAAREALTLPPTMQSGAYQFTPPPAPDAGRAKPAEAVKVEPLPAPEPIQTTQIPRVTVPERPVTLPGPPAATPPPAPVSTAPAATATAPTASTTPFRLAGRWQLQRGGYSRSPAVPQSLVVTINESGGTFQGTLDGRYRSRSKIDRVHFSFSGKLDKGNPRFTWTSMDGRRSEIEFIPVPNSADVIEVVWQSSGSKQVFDEMLKRAN